MDISKDSQDYKNWKKRHTNDSYSDYLNMVRKDQEGEVKKSISASFQPVYQNIDRMKADLPERQKEQQAYIEDLYGQQGNIIGTQEERSMGKIDYQQQEQGKERDIALRDLASDLRKSFQAGNRYLGVRGASDSSAANQMSYALQREGQRQQSNVQQQYLSNIGSLDQARADITAQATQARQELGMWKTNSLMDITNWFRTRYDELETAKAGASQQEASALANLQADIYNSTLNQINQINMMNMQNEMNLQNWQIQREAALEDYAKQLQIESQYQTNPITYSAPSINATPTTTPTTNIPSAPSAFDFMNNRSPYSPPMSIDQSNLSPTQRLMNMGFRPNQNMSIDPTRFR